MDPYAVLGVSSSSSYQEIRAAYMALALKHHPDKYKGDEPDAFVDISASWALLSDPVQRAEFDRSKSIKKFRPICEAVSLNELTHNQAGVYTKACRCGDTFEVFQSDLEDGVNCIQCNGCSLHISIEMC